MRVTVYGASDDLIEVEGDLDSEFYLPSDDEALIAFSEGTLLRIKYDGVWRITQVFKGRSSVSLTQAPEDDENNYSDRAVVDGPIEWVALATAYAKKPKA